MVVSLFEKYLDLKLYVEKDGLSRYRLTGLLPRAKSLSSTDEDTMQTWKPKIADSREACFSSEGKVQTRFYFVPKDKGGIVLSINGVEFSELRAVQEKGSDNVMFLAHGKSPEGQEYYDVMSPNGWSIMAHWSQALVQFNKSMHEGAKARDGARKAACLDLAKTLKGKVSATTMKATLKGEGYTDAQVDFAVYELGKADALNEKK